MVQVSPGLVAKLETANPTGSIKDRLVQHLVKKALSRGEITNETVLVEATSGNTGISLSAIGAALGLKVKIIMPENMSKERRQMMCALGAEIINVGPSDFSAAIIERNKLSAANGYWSPRQFENSENIECHSLHTAGEIVSQLLGRKFSAFVSGAGTGGTIMGVRHAVLAAGLDTKIVLAQPAETAESHGIQGINDGANFLAQPDLLDCIISVPTATAIARASSFARSRGVLVGVSSGANLYAAEKYIETYKPAGTVVTILCDRGERYLS